MEVVNQRLTQVMAAVQAMPPAARWMAALSLLVAMASLVWLGRGQLTPDDVYLMGGTAFTTTQLQHMEGALGQAGLMDYQVEGARIRVPRGQQARYMAALAEAGALPADFGQYLQKAVNSNGFMLYGSRQEAQLKVAIQTELQGLINNFQGIERSFVQIAEEHGTGFPRTKTVTASVGVQPAAGQPLDERSVAAIRWIVAGAWGGLKPDSVTVVDLNSRRLFAGPLDPAAPSPAAYAEVKRQLELDWEEKIARAVGISGLIVTANVELDESGRTARQVSASVAVPAEHFQFLFRQLHTPPASGRAARPDPLVWAEFEQQECQRIKQAIAPLLITADAHREPLIAVSALRVPPPAGETLDWNTLAAAWVRQNWQALGIATLVIAALVLMPLAVRSRATASPLAEDSTDQSTLVLVTPEEPVAARTVVPPPHHPFDARREELVELIRQDPQAAASVLRTWLGNAS